MNEEKNNRCEIPKVVVTGAIISAMMVGPPAAELLHEKYYGNITSLQPAVFARDFNDHPFEDHTPNFPTSPSIAFTDTSSGSTLTNSM